VILVGGSSAIPKLKQRIVDYYGGDLAIIKDEETIKPDELVAHGATKLAHDLLIRDKNFIISDVCPLTLGTDIAIREDLNWFVALWRQPDIEL